MAVNTNTGVADLGRGMLKIGQDVSKILENVDSQNGVVSDMYIFYRLPTCANRRLDSEQVSSFNY